MNEIMNSKLEETLQFARSELEALSAPGALSNNKNYNNIKDDIEVAFKTFQAAIFPLHTNPENKSIEENLALACEKLIGAIKKIDENLDAEEITANLLKKLPEIRKVLMTDINAAYQGDPAAKNLDEIIISYPAFIAISAHRIAHELYIMDVPLVPRIISEYAHSKTGIDIHPGAKIGEYFFIDHGTGVVIGETSTIGSHVKLYQNVTIGAKSFAVNPDGSLVKGIKRHPDIGNNVIIYAGATILGGDTKISDNCIIGGNVWLTHSVEDGQVVIRNEE
ncbi:MAG: hypothetical protein IJ597_03930 [Synergistaceae bacterium]|nr:hypothetical protein [Synergistaceae bacterium]